MNKYISFTAHIVVFSIICSFGTVTSFLSNSKVRVPTELLTVDSDLCYGPEQKHNSLYILEIPPFVGNSYNGFKEALAFKESQGEYCRVNTFGYLGKYQFGINTLKLLGVNDSKGFLEDSALQEKAFYANTKRNKWILRKDIQRFEGKRIRGIRITESGILAAAHLSGAGNVRKYLRTYGKYDVSDAYGSSIFHYIDTFSGYEVAASIPMQRKPRV